MFTEFDLDAMNSLPEPIQVHLHEYIRFLETNYRIDGPAMSEKEFEKFLADRLKDAADPAQRVPGAAVLQKIRARFEQQPA